MEICDGTGGGDWVGLGGKGRVLVKTAGLFSKARAGRVWRQAGGKLAALQSRNYP